VERSGVGGGPNEAATTFATQRLTKRPPDVMIK
jgi:hypothetical protein